MGNRDGTSGLSIVRAMIKETIQKHAIIILRIVSTYEPFR
jgi:hypothetical protein